ncbi:adenylate isopentenyltransferase [Manihot esculenta]|uniref:Adenylate isopentenyltransferase n=1 Tax=Manihot esculenta TaxID=3983 RepID=A0A2C9UK45_MANES|nr:adenylate isopentenyltransferase [Manihot esculenta]OAY31328.1 hypothetical protein MANES_14G103300v8 [Manihot esculenta]
MRLPFPTIHSHCTSHALPSLPFSLPFFKPSPRRPPRGVRMDSSDRPISTLSLRRQKDKILVIMGATGCGKSKLSIDLATRFQAEIINSDKMQVYKGLDITTNKIPIHERNGVAHHLLGVFDPLDGEVSASEFRLTAGLAISDILSRQKLPMVVGGSNSFIHALVVDRFNPDLDVFGGASNPVSTQLRYNCCFVWVDVSLPVLEDYLCYRVDEMLESGMPEELSEYYRWEDPASQPGLRKAIGVPEFERYFKRYPPGRAGAGAGGGEWDEAQRREYEEAVREIKENTCELAKRQIGKMMRLKGAGWELQRVDATEAFREAMKVRTASDSSKNNKKKKRKKKRWMEVWERDVVQPSMKIVNRFLEE